MRRNIFLKSTLRQPLRTALLLLLAGLVSFAFISRAVEYVVVDREMNKLSVFYHSIGSLERIEGNDGDLSAAMELIAGSRHLGFEDKRRYTSGVLDGIYNAEIGGFRSDYELTNIDLIDFHFEYGLHRSDVFLYGEVKHKSYMNGMDIYSFIMSIDKVEAAYPEIVQEATDFMMFFPAGAISEADFEDLEIGKRYFIKAYAHPSDDFLPMQMSGAKRLTMKLLNSDDNLWFAPVPLGSAVDFTLPGLSGIPEELDILRENQSSLTVIGTVDMSAMPFMQPISRQNRLTDGRWLNYNDNIEGKNVCVIHNYLAKLRGYSVGDTIKLKLRDTKNHLGAILDSDANWRDYPTQDMEFEIVGTYVTSSEDTGGFSSTDMYVPDSCLPEGFGVVMPEAQGIDAIYDYSFVLDSSRNQSAFILENKDALNELGFELSFIENNAKSFWASIIPLSQSTAASAGLMAVVLVLSSTLIVFLYLRQRQKDFSILRALGLPARKAVRQLLVPLVMLWGPAIILGGAAAWVFAISKASETLEGVNIPEGVEASGALSIVWLVGLCAAVLGLFLILALIGAQLSARRPVFALLQGSTGGKPQKHIPSETTTARAVDTGSKSVQIKADSRVDIVVSSDISNNARLMPSIRYIMRHIRRSTVKSILTVAVALFFMLALGWLQTSINRGEQEVEHLYDTTIVKAEIVAANAQAVMQGALAGQIVYKPTVDAIMDSGFVQSVYLEGCHQWIFLSTDEDKKGMDYDDIKHMYSFNDFAAFYSDTGADITIEYAENWGEEAFLRDYAKGDVIPLILTHELMEEMGVELGDTLYSIMDFAEFGPRTTYACVVAGRYTGEIRVNAYLTTIVPYRALELIVGKYTRYRIVRFELDPAKNREMATFREEATRIVGKGSAGYTDLKLLIWDEELRMVVAPLEKNLSLMRVLYPVTIAAAALIAFGLSMLLMFQNAKEAAIIRVLGSTKQHLRTILCSGQLLLCIVGILLGLLIQGVLDVSVALSMSLLLCALLYFAATLVGSLMSVVLISNKKPLELLQTKG